MLEQIESFIEMGLSFCVSTILRVDPLDERLIEIEVSVPPGQNAKADIHNVDIASQEA